jgi:exodeoxyribonuclease VII small subunit
VVGVAEEQEGAAEGTPSYERARDELAEVVRDLEKGGLTLEESLALWERGEKLARICEHWLEGARARLAAAQATAEDTEEAPAGGNGDTPF